MYSSSGVESSLTGLAKIRPHTLDYSFLDTFGGTTQGLPDFFSIYDGREIPNQETFDDRFTPAVRPLPMGCTAVSTTFIGGLEDNTLYRPDKLYFATPPGTDGQGRDMRVTFDTAKNWGLERVDGTRVKKGDYYNCYGSGKIDDFDAARIALWINQQEKRAVSVGSWWYWGDVPNNTLVPDGNLSTPSFNTNRAGLHNWIIVGWEDSDTLIGIPWCGMNYGDKGLVYVSRELYKKLMAQPHTGAFTLATTPAGGATNIGYAALTDHIVYSLNQFIRNLFNV